MNNSLTDNISNMRPSAESIAAGSLRDQSSRLTDLLSLFRIGPTDTRAA